MNQTHERALVKGLHELSLQFAPTPRNAVPKERIAVYVRQLSDLPLREVLDALDRCGKTCEEFPSVSAIRREVGEVAANQSETAENAWPIVRKEISRTGQYRTPHFDSPLIAMTVESIGWKTLCGMDATVAQEKFMWTYKANRKHAVGTIQRGDFRDVSADGPALPSGTLRRLGDEVA